MNGHKGLLLSIVSIGLYTLLSLVVVNRANALPTPNFCFAFGDDGDTLHIMLTDGTSQSAAPQAAGVRDIEAIAFSPFDQTLYAADEDVFGSLNYDFSDVTNGGLFTAIGAFGSVNGADGIAPMDDVDSLAFDPISGTLYGVDREDDAHDRLFIINVNDGSADQNAFGTNIGYLVLSDNNVATVWDEDIDDLAIDPTDGRLYAIANSGGTGDHLITIDRDTGAITDLGVLSAEDVEGLAFFNDGTLYATTGNNAATADQDSLWRIDIGTPPVANVINQFTSDGDYEGVDCLIGDPNSKSGFVFADVNNNGTFDSGEPRLQNILVEIYRDDGNVDNVIDVNDTFLTTATTDANGLYDFNMAAVGEFILQVDINSLPAGVSVSDNVEIANFDACNAPAAPYDDFGCAEPNNDFPTVQSAVAAADLRIEKVDDVDPVVVGATVTYTITVTNDGPDTATNVTVTDSFSGAAFTVTNVTSSQGGCVSFPCTLGTLANGATATITITGTAGAAGTIVNNTGVSADQNDPNPANNDAQDATVVSTSGVNPPVGPTDAAPVSDAPSTTGVTTSQGLVLTKLSDTTTVVLGESLNFTITVTNPTSQAIQNITLTDVVPEYYDVISATITQGTVSTDGNTITVNIGTLQPQQTVTLTIRTETVRAGFAPDTCNRVLIGTEESNTVCPDIFPNVLPQTGQSPLAPFRSLLIVLVSTLGITLIIRNKVVAILR